MGAPTSNRRKRDDFCNTLNCQHQYLNSSNLDNLLISHVSKKPKISQSMHLNSEIPGSTKSTALRIYRYPEPVNPLPREIHAPYRVPRFGFQESLNRESRLRRVGFWREALGEVMGNALSSPFDWTKNRTSEALRCCTKKGKEVIYVDDDEQTDKDNVTDDSSIKEAEFVEDRHKGELVVLDKRLQGKLEEKNFQPSSSSAVSVMTDANLKVDGSGTTVSSLLPNRDAEALGLPTHKRLLATAERRNTKLSSLGFQISLLERLRARFQLLRPAKKPEEEDALQDVLREPFVPLAEEEEVEVSKALSNSSRRKVLVSHENSNIEITGEILQCLRPREWLNDEVINVYLELLKEREKREPKKFLKCHFFNTFFYKKLTGGGSGYHFKAVRRWTNPKKLGYCLLECDKIFVPIHQEIHWCLAVINKKDQKFQYLDSLRGVDAQVLRALARYFVDEVKDKSGVDIDVSSWKVEYVEDLPEQENRWDCGMFMIKYADFYSRDVGLCFNQEHMPYFRRRTVKEILRLKAE
ncbi:Ulp1 peptidase [Bertholletia excelsa]